MASIRGGIVLVPDGARAGAGSGQCYYGLTPSQAAALGVTLGAGTNGYTAPNGKFDRVRAASFVLDVSAAATVAGDTLDVYVSAAIDADNPAGPAAWDDFVHFAQVLGNGGVKRLTADWVADVTPTTPHRNTQDKALAAATVLQGPIESGIIRVAWVTVGTGSFTFAVSCLAQAWRGRS